MPAREHAKGEHKPQAEEKGRDREDRHRGNIKKKCAQDSDEQCREQDAEANECVKFHAR